MFERINDTWLTIVGNGNSLQLQLYGKDIAQPALNFNADEKGRIRCLDCCHAGFRRCMMMAAQSISSTNYLVHLPLGVLKGLCGKEQEFSFTLFVPPAWLRPHARIGLPNAQDRLPAPFPFSIDFCLLDKNHKYLQYPRPASPPHATLNLSFAVRIVSRALQFNDPGGIPPAGWKRP